MPRIHSPDLLKNFRNGLFQGTGGGSKKKCYSPLKNGRCGTSFRTAPVPWQKAGYCLRASSANLPVHGGTGFHRTFVKKAIPNMGTHPPNCLFVRIFNTAFLKQEGYNQTSLKSICSQYQACLCIHREVR